MHERRKCNKQQRDLAANRMRLLTVATKEIVTLSVVG
jgi:hypothetical protein